MKRNLLLKTTLALAIASPLMASAESQLTTGGGSAVARLNLEVIIPSVLFLGVGTGSDLTNTSNSNADTLTFDYTTNADQVGIPGSPAADIRDTNGGFPGNGQIPVRVFGNNGQVTIRADNPPNLVNGADTIPFTEMSVVSNNTNLPAPGFSGTNTSQPLLAGRVTNQSALWTYSYGNSTAPAAGTYTGTVTYTASML
ncbi:MAG TPA: hypothetical protein VLG41_22740 [Hydrogenophaga sp.]|uniref:hypothetical protein n=1 Tax=Hydrogenophaga sp. TaxID=1904254 RepID=UPI002BECCAC6|nr:hypothetical protein [Hydrogenophaga sp.]HSX95764.1 hypothetical protein [Hydrogenophaga sp.]